MTQDRLYYDHLSDMEPLLPSRDESRVRSAVELLRTSERIRGGLSEQTIRSIARFVRSMNGYYSNLIEGQHTLPGEIDQALAKKFSPEDEKHKRQVLHRAHFDAQRRMEEYLEDEAVNIASGEFIKWIHRVFHEQLPEEYRVIYNTNGEPCGKLEPGEFRKGQVRVGGHEAPAAEAIDELINRFESVYSGKAEIADGYALMIGAAAHHRLAWIHPFDDGNGRVARLFSQAWFIRSRSDAFGLWSISRGLARKKDDYYRYLAGADRDREGDYDGRGSRTQKGLDAFVGFFIECADDQLGLMEELLKLDALTKRLHEYCHLRASEKKLPRGVGPLLETIIYKGSIARGEVSGILDCSSRKATSVIRELLDIGLLATDTEKGRIRLGIPEDAAGWLFPKLYPGS